MNNIRSIELQDIKNDKLQQEIVRQTYRVHVDPKDDITVIINGNSYQVVDISLEGISIACTDNTAFRIEQAVDNCELKTPTSTIKNLTGQIVHFSCDSKKRWQNGIQWIKFEKATSQKISTLVTSMKEKLLKESSSSV